jgi:phosphomannomutase
LIGRDTRESGEWIERELARGLTGGGATAVSVGVIPTPGVAYLTGTDAFDAGIVISASHNPFEDNGIKIFARREARCGLRESHRNAGRRFVDDDRCVESDIDRSTARR